MRQSLLGSHHQSTCRKAVSSTTSKTDNRHNKQHLYMVHKSYHSLPRYRDGMMHEETISDPAGTARHGILSTRLPTYRINTLLPSVRSADDPARATSIMQIDFASVILRDHSHRFVALIPVGTVLVLVIEASQTTWINNIEIAVLHGDC